MATETAVIALMVAERERERQIVQRRLDEIDAQISAIREAAKRMGVDLGVAGAADVRAAKRTAGKRDRALTANWITILRFIGSRDTASLDEIMEFTEAHALNIQRNTLRSQTSIYADRGWLDRVDQGVFRLTREGAEKAGIETEEGSDIPSEPSSTSVGAAAGAQGGPSQPRPEGSIPSASTFRAARDLMSTTAIPSVQQLPITASGGGRR